MANAGLTNLRRSIRRRAVTPGQYKKVRLTCYDSAGGSLLTLAEVQVRPNPGVAASMADCTPTAQSVTGSNFATLGTDGLNGTAWTSGAGASTSGNWFMMEFATKRDFEQLYIYPGGSTHFGNCPTVIDVEASEDGTTFTTLGTFNATTWAAGVAQTWNVP